MTSEGYVLTWHDLGAAVQYRIDRESEDGSTAHFIVSSTVTSFMDSDPNHGLTTYSVTAIRADGEADQSNAAITMWPGCLPAVDPGPTPVWPYDCRCPLPAPLPPFPPYICQ